MANETELKYAPSVGFSAERLFLLPEISPYCGQVTTIEMKTEYLDTPDFDARKHKITLRRRFENGKSIIYAKCPISVEGELSVRGEWSVESDDLSRACELLAKEGAPTMPLFKLPLKVTGSVSFVRQEACVTLCDGLCFSLSYDDGFLGKGVPFSEIELELIKGGPDALLLFGRRLAEKYGFSPEPRSKYERAVEHSF